MAEVTVLSLLGQPVYAHRRLRGRRYRSSLGYSNHRGLQLLDKHLATAFQYTPLSILTSCCRRSDRYRSRTSRRTIALIIESIARTMKWITKPDKFVYKHVPKQCLREISIDFSLTLLVSKGRYIGFVPQIT